ncbi:unnamed protein product [Adineta steineri]|uniref:EGF-like domain-containing protein n=1 Tax=Adineta steineri TaxID=433720 RepID=A0A813QDY6_9BILA|nr:unnamed protein product [Adineta steineri]CAF3960028.1 unnamed protein product [Adineta steineri]
MRSSTIVVVALALVAIISKHSTVATPTTLPPCNDATCCATSTCAPCDDNGTTRSCYGMPSYFGRYIYGLNSAPDCGGDYVMHDCPSDVCLCENGGTCTGSDGTCECTGGWTGERCQTPPPCNAATCVGKQTCVACDDNGTLSYCNGRHLRFDYSIYTFDGQLYNYNGVYDTNGNIGDPDNYIRVGPSLDNICYVVYRCPFRCADGNGFAAGVGTC